MEKSLKIQWKKRAEKSLKQIDAWYLKKMGVTAADKFTCGILDCVEMLAQNPWAGPIEIKSEELLHEYRSFVEHKNHKIIYYVENDILYIADIWSSNMNPRKIKSRLK